MPGLRTGRHICGSTYACAHRCACARQTYQTHALLATAIVSVANMRIIKSGACVSARAGGPFHYRRVHDRADVRACLCVCVQT